MNKKFQLLLTTTLTITDREEQRKYKRDFIKLMNQYHSFSSIKQLIKRIICKVYWLAV